MNARVYIPPGLEAVIALHADLLREYPGRMTVPEVLGRQAHTLETAHRNGNPAVCIQISNWLPGYARLGDDEILERALSIDDLRLTVAREHGFESWSDVGLAANVRFDRAFEAAVNAVVGGQLPVLERLLFENPALVETRSPYGHRATLLHYVAANGVETWRQTVPRIAPHIVRRLIEGGANPSAKAPFYGGEYTTAALVESSAHPAAAGLTEAILKELERT